MSKAVENRGKGLLFADMLAWAEEKPDFAVLTFDNHPHADEVLTYADLVLRGNKLVQALAKAGIGRGDSFSTVMRNHPEQVLSMYAASALGAIMVPIDPRAKGEKLKYQLHNSDSKCVLFASEFMDRMEVELAALPGVKVLGVLYKDESGVPVSSKYPNLDEILDGPEAPGVTLTNQSGSDPMTMIYTSGTTGNPKGVRQLGERTVGAVGLAQMIWEYTSEDKPYTGLSLTHGNAIAVTLMPALEMAIPAVISRRFTKSRIWDVCRAHGCTTFSLLGGMMMGIYSEPERPNDGDNPVRKVISAGTPFAIWESFEKRFNVQIHEWYAAVEGGFAHKPPGVGPIGSFGKPVDTMMEMKVVREDDTECEPGEKGELISRSKTGETKVTYHKNAEASDAKTRGGWLRSGDIVHRDEEGWYYFDFRKGGGLRRQGDFIMPEHVEAVIAEHPEVSDVCVFGITAASGAPGESDLVAAIVAADGGDPDIKSVFALCLEGLERNSVPSYVQVVPEIPKTASEKNLTRILKDEFKADAAGVYRFEDYA